MSFPVGLRTFAGGGVAAESLGDDAWFAHLYSMYPVPAGHLQSGVHRAYPFARCYEFSLCALLEVCYGLEES
jgi:hypothetical protein